MINTFEIGINALETFITTFFLTLYFGCRYKGIKAVGGFVFGWGLVFCVLTFLNNTFVYESYLTFALVLSYLIYSVLFLKGDIIMNRPPKVRPKI